jgi:hypothetical protein
MKPRSALAAILAAAAVNLAPLAPARAADVHIGITIAAPPQLVVVPRMPVYYAPALPYNYFFYNGQYYLFHEGRWFYGPTYNGPWHFIALEYVPVPVLRVPVQYYKAPPGHWKRRKGPPPWAPAWGHGKSWERR